MLQRTESDATILRTPWAAAAVLFAIWLAMLLLGGTEPDRQLLISAYAGDRPLMGPAIFLTRLGDWEVLVALTCFGCGWLLLRRQWRLAALLLGSTLAARLLVTLQKILFARVRPAETQHLVEVQTLSFPSGHSANSMVVYVLLAIFLIRDDGTRTIAVAAAILLSVLIGTSRVLLGVHWPSDVVGGWAFGLLWVIAVVQWARPRFVGGLDTGAAGR